MPDALAGLYAMRPGAASSATPRPAPRLPWRDTLATVRVRGHMEFETFRSKRPGEDRQMTTFDDREKAYEAKYAHDEEMAFRANARRNKLLGLWAAELMGKTGEAASSYALEVVKADFEEAGHEDVVRKVAADLDGKATADEIRAKMEALLIVAKGQLASEG
jgi:hypothetical protein